MKGGYNDEWVFETEDCKPYLMNRDFWSEIRFDPVWW